jgi:hypothetical protein
MECRLVVIERLVRLRTAGFYSLEQRNVDVKEE